MHSILPGDRPSQTEGEARTQEKPEGRHRHPDHRRDLLVEAVSTLAQFRTPDPGAPLTVLTHQSSIKKMPHGHVHRSIRQTPQGVFAFLK